MAKIFLKRKKAAATFLPEIGFNRTLKIRRMIQSPVKIEIDL